MDKIKKYFSKKRNLVAWIISITVFIFILFLWAIYTKDQPKIIPEDIREDIRAGIQEAVAEPIKSVSLSVGEAIEDAAYDSGSESEGSDQGTEGSNQDGEIDPTANWSTYVDEETGVSMKYPEGWEVTELSGFEAVFTPSLNMVELEDLGGDYEETDVPYWGGKLIGYNVFESTLSLEKFIYSYLGNTGVSVNRYEPSNCLEVVDEGDDRFGGGTGYYYYFKNNDTIIELSLDYYLEQVPNNEYINFLEDIANSVTL